MGDKSRLKFQFISQWLKSPLSPLSLTRRTNVRLRSLMRQYRRFFLTERLRGTFIGDTQIIVGQGLAPAACLHDFFRQEQAPALHWFPKFWCLLNKSK